MKILNLTQHPATTDQKNQGVVELPQNERDELIKHLSFVGMPSKEDVAARASAIAEIAARYRLTKLAESFVGANICGFNNYPWDCSLKATAQELELGCMIGGYPALMHPLHMSLERHGLHVVYAHSERVSQETLSEDGTVTKNNVFKHVGFV